MGWYGLIYQPAQHGWVRDSGDDDGLFSRWLEGPVSSGLRPSSFGVHGRYGREIHHHCHCRSYAIKPYHVTFYKERVLPTQSNKYHVCIGTVISVGTLSEQFWVFLFICPEKLFIIRPFTKFGKKNLFPIRIIWNLVRRSMFVCICEIGTQPPSHSHTPPLRYLI